MHQRSSVRPATRLLGGAIVALGSATIAVVMSAGNCFPLCVLYDVWDPLWYAFACWTCGV